MRDSRRDGTPPEPPSCPRRRQEAERKARVGQFPHRTRTLNEESDKGDAVKPGVLSFSNHRGRFDGRKNNQRTQIMRQLTGHIVNPANDKLSITVVDEPGSGGANHRYEIGGFDTTTNASNPGDLPPWDGTTILFQNGPIGEKGVNGITQEVLLAIVIDRLEGFQAGPYRSRENAIALTHLQEAQMWLQTRTRERMARGVEGTHQK